MFFCAFFTDSFPITFFSRFVLRTAKNFQCSLKTIPVSYLYLRPRTLPLNKKLSSLFQFILPFSVYFLAMDSLPFSFGPGSYYRWGCCYCYYYYYCCFHLHYCCWNMKGVRTIFLFMWNVFIFINLLILLIIFIFINLLILFIIFIFINLLILFIIFIFINLLILLIILTIVLRVMREKDVKEEIEKHPGKQRIVSIYINTMN